jgi:ABC-type transport system involved in cytochrome c biogenesis permease subunit
VKNVRKWLPWAVGGLAIAGALVAAAPPSKVRGFDLEAFASLPVLEGGRVKPIDSVARNSLLMIRSQQTFRFEGAKVGASEWLLDAMFRPDRANHQPVFYVNDPDVLGMLGLQQGSTRYYSFEQLLPRIGELQRQAMLAEQVDAKQRTRFQAAVVNLFNRVYLYHRLKNTVQLEGTPLAAELAGRASAVAPQRHDALVQTSFFRPLPPPAGADENAWRTVGETLRAGTGGGPLVGWAMVSAAWAAQDPSSFNTAVARLRGESSDGAQTLARHELLFNRAQPFYLGIVIYVLAFLVLCVSWVWKPHLLQPAALALLTSGAVVHTAGLVYRTVLQGRPPVTNLYSSAVFVGWGAVLLGIILERMYRRGFGTAVAAASGFASLLVAHHLSGDGDTMEMMRAVLDSNFWLATHVVTITIGYSGTYVAGAIAIAYTLRRHLARKQDPASTKTLVSMTYGILCFSLFFSFLGTVLGGIWADQSWGRFWGWDPKENGALLIVLWNGVILHARLGGFVREKGIMAMAIFGNVITSLSWFGVNMLGVGLHSYGFMDSAFWALTGFCGSQLLLMAICLAPQRFWASRSAAAESRRPEDPEPA